MSGVVDRTDFEKQGLGAATPDGGRGDPVASASGRRREAQLLILISRDEMRCCVDPVDMPWQQGVLDDAGSGRPGRPGRKRTSSASGLPASSRTSVQCDVASSSPVGCDWVLRLPSLQQWRAARLSVLSRRVLRCATGSGPHVAHGSLRTCCGKRGALFSTYVCAPQGVHAVAGNANQSRQAACNQANPMIGCRVQQTCTARVEQTAEVVRNGTGGRCSGVATPGPKARNETAVVRRTKVRPTPCPARWTPCLAGTVANWDRMHAADVDGGAIFETNPMRGVRQDSGCFARSRPRSRAARQCPPSGRRQTAGSTDGKLESRRSGQPDQARNPSRKGQGAGKTEQQTAKQQTKTSVNVGGGTRRTGHRPCRTVHRPASLPSGRGEGGAHRLRSAGVSDVSRRER